MFWPNKNSIYIDWRAVSIEQYLASLNIDKNTEETSVVTVEEAEQSTEQNTISVSLEELRTTYLQIHNKEVPNNKKNDAERILSKLK